MSTGLAATFDLLARSENEASVDVLIAALDAPQTRIQEQALRTILRRRSRSGKLELLRRLHTFSDAWRRVMAEHRGQMSQPLRDALLSGEPQLCINACQAIIWFKEFDLMPALVNVLENEAHVHADLAAKTVIELTDALYQELAAPRDYRERRDPQMVRRHVTSCLERSAQRFHKHQRKEVLEALLLLCARDNTVIKQILHDPFHASYLPLVDLLLHSERTGVVRLLLSFLDDPHPPSAALSALARRSDSRFVRALLKKVGYEPTAQAAANLKRVEQIPWVHPHQGQLLLLDDAGQHSLVKLLMATGIKRLDLFKTIEYLALHGSTGGRRAAFEALAEFSGAEANALALKALDDTDPMVQAIVARQLRNRSIPGALPRLIEMAESKHEAVREAVRDSLSEFRFQRFLLSYDLLEPEVRQSTGLLVRKLDPQAVVQLIDEMQSPSRTRRLRSVGLAVAMHVVLEVEHQLITLLADPDHLVRMEAAQALSVCSSAEAVSALNTALTDRSVLVQDAARLSLQSIAQRRPSVLPLLQTNSWLPTSQPFAGEVNL